MVDIVIWDAVDEPSVSSGDLVLAVGVRDEDEIASLLGRLARHRVAGVVVKLGSPPSTPLRDGLRRAAEESGTPLLQLTSGASWEQIVVLVRSLLVSGAPDGSTSATGAVHDLFELAEVVSAVLDAPITIEDRSSRVLAFSGRQSGVDEARSETILGRHVPERYTRLLEERGVFRRLLTDSGPVHVGRLTDDMLPRVAISVRANDEVLGSIWVASDGPLSPEREAWLVEAARLVALHLLRLRAEADTGQRLRREQLAVLLGGGEPSVEMANRLGLVPGPSCVVAATPRRAEPASAEADLQRLMTSLSVHLTAVRPRSTVARIGSVVYAVVSPVDEKDDDGSGPARLMADFVRYADQGQSFLVAIGRPARGVNDLVRSRNDADKALEVLRRHDAGRQVVRFVDVQVESLLVRMADLLAEDEEVMLGPIEELVAYDESHHAGLLDTLVAYLDCFGDVAEAASAVHVHPNTFRYRLRRLASVSGMDLTDPDVRFATMLRLRLRALVEAAEGSPALSEVASAS